MKKFWKKALGLVTLAAAIPVKVTHSEDGKTTYQSLLLSLDVTSRDENGEVSVELDPAKGVLTGAIHEMAAARREAEMYADYDLTPAAAPAPTEGDDGSCETTFG